MVLKHQVIYRLYSCPHPTPPSLTVPSCQTRDIFYIAVTLGHVHTNAPWSRRERVAKQTPFPPSPQFQALLLVFWFGWITPTLSQAPGPNLVITLNSFPFVPESWTFHLKSILCHHPNSWLLTFLCYFRSPPSVTFPTVSFPFSPAVKSLTLTLSVAPHHQMNQVKIFHCQIQTVFAK